MNVQDVAKRITDAIALCKFGSEAMKSAMTSGKQYKVRGLLENAVVFEGPEALSALNEAANSIREFDPGINSTVSQKNVEIRVISAIRDAQINGVITTAMVESIRQDLLASPLLSRRVFREAFGVDVDGGGSPLVLGDFTLYNFKTHKAHIEPPPPEPFWIGDHGVLVECAIDARDNEKASELADVLFNRLDFALRILMGLRGERFGLGVLNAVRVSHEQYYVLSAAGAHSSSSRKGMAQPIPLSTPFFSQPPAQRLWKIISQPKNDLERRLVRCIEWLGQAIVESSVSSAIVKCATGLESLLALQEKGLINASIASSISEASAHILGNSANEALAIERQVKKLYGMRSAIVHSGGEGGSESDLALFIDIVRSLIFKLLTDERFASTTNLGAVFEVFRLMKYAHRNNVDNAATS